VIAIVETRPRVFAVLWYTGPPPSPTIEKTTTRSYGYRLMANSVPLLEMHMGVRPPIMVYVCL
jgi:hypothetical protein